VVGVTADTNIYISALNFGGLPDKLLDLARAGEIRLSISADIMDEIAHVLRNKFRWTEEAVELAKDRIGDFARLVEPSQDIGVLKTDPTDNRISNALRRRSPISSSPETITC
jgi:predicted nucleic acid-binding protein